MGYVTQWIFLTASIVIGYIYFYAVPAQYNGNDLAERMDRTLQD